MSTLRLFQVALEIWASILNIVILVVTARYVSENSVGKHLWRLIMLGTLLISSEAASVVIVNSSFQMIPGIAQSVTLLRSLLEILILLIFMIDTNYVIYRSERVHWTVLLLIAVVASITEFIARIVNLWTGVYYYFDADTVYHRGDFMGISFAAPAIILILWLVEILRSKHLLGRRLYRTCIIIFFVIVSAVVEGFFVVDFELIDIAIVLCVEIFYLAYLSEIRLETMDRLVQEFYDVTKRQKKEESL